MYLGPDPVTVDRLFVDGAGVKGFVDPEVETNRSWTKEQEFDIEDIEEFQLLQDVVC